MIKHGLDQIRDAARALKEEAEALTERLRLTRLKELDLINKKLGEDFHDLVMIAARTCGTDIAQITLIDDLHQYIMMRVGPDGPVVSNRSDAVCNITMQHPNEVTVISDATQDGRVVNNPWVIKGLKFYAGAPLVTSDGLPLGAICAVSDQPNKLNEQQREIMLALARLTTSILTKLPPS